MPKYDTFGNVTISCFVNKYVSQKEDCTLLRDESAPIVPSYSAIYNYRCHAVCTVSKHEVGGFRQKRPTVLNCLFQTCHSSGDGYVSPTHIAP